MRSRSRAAHSVLSKRVVAHRLTAAGTKMLAAGTSVARGVAVRAFAKLSAAEVATLHDLLLRVCEAPEG